MRVLLVLLLCLLLLPTFGLAQEVTPVATPVIIDGSTPPVPGDFPVVPPVEDAPAGMLAIITLSLATFFAVELIKQFLYAKLDVERSIGTHNYRLLNLATGFVVAAVILTLLADPPNAAAVIPGLRTDLHPVFGRLLTILMVGGGESVAWAIYRIASRQPVVIPASATYVPPR